MPKYLPRLKRRMDLSEWTFLNGPFRTHSAIYVSTKTFPVRDITYVLPAQIYKPSFISIARQWPTWLCLACLPTGRGLRIEQSSTSSSAMKSRTSWLQSLSHVIGRANLLETGHLTTDLHRLLKEASVEAGMVRVERALLPLLRPKQ